MSIEFKNSALEELYTDGSTEDRQYKRLSKEIVKRYVKVVNYLKHHCERITYRNIQAL